MDTLRGNFDALGNERDYDAGEDDTGREAPPTAIGTDERRMQVRAYNHWASLLEDRNFPAIDDLEPEDLPDFGPHSVLLDFTAGVENPGIVYLGTELAKECDISADELQTLSDVPARSLLSRITDHYMQILANQAPIGFEAEFVNQRGATILYRGVLLPYSSDDETIDFIFGVINWKELADQHTSDELLLQVDQALEHRPEAAPHRTDDTPMTDWADGPGALPANDLGDDGFEVEVEAGQGASEDQDDGTPFDYAAKFNLSYDDGDEEYDEDEEESGLPRPSFGSLTSIGGIRKTERTAVLPEVPEEERDFASADDIAEMDLEDVQAGVEYDDTSYVVEPAHGDPEAVDVSAMPTFDSALPSGPNPGLDEELAGGVLELQALDPAEMELGDWLAVARELAAAARTSEDRTRGALYEAIGRAYDFSLAAEEKPEDFEELLADSGLTVQERAPMTPVVKLVFGADYDKTRITEYAAALSHARRLELPRGSLGEYLRQVEGGLKGVVQAERRMRKTESGKDIGEDPREVLAARLRAMPALDFADLDPSGTEFGLVMIRRNDSGEIEILGEVPEDVTLLEKAAKKLVG